MNKDLVKEVYISFFYLGKSPIAPGTFGTLGGVLVSYLAILFLDDFAGYFLHHIFLQPMELERLRSNT